LDIEADDSMVLPAWDLSISLSLGFGFDLCPFGFVEDSAT